MIIYCIENSINGKLYVGQYSKVNSNEEFQKCRYFGSGKHLKNSQLKYGLENFRKWVIIKNIHTKKELDHYEKLWIKKLNTKNPNGYNLTDGGEGALGAIRSEKTRNKMSVFQLSRKRSKFSDSWVKNMANSHKGKKHSDTTKRKIGDSQRGKIVSDETRKKISDSSKGKIISNKTKEKMSIAKKGENVSDETRKKISDGNKGKIVSNKTKEKMSIAKKGKHQSKEHIKNRIDSKKRNKIFKGESKIEQTNTL